MQNYLNSNSYSEIDIQELLIVLWVHKLIIVFAFTVSILWAGYYASNADKSFTSSATFYSKTDQRDNLDFMSSGLNLSNITGLSNKSAGLSKSQINGRIFIKKIDAKLDLKGDPFFNKYNSQLVDSVWKSAIKRAIGWQSSQGDIQETIWQGISKNFSKNIKLTETDDGAKKISFTHEDPVRASAIANAIMMEIISSKTQKKNNIQDGQLSYLSNQLANALDDLEKSQSNLKAFTIDNSALPTSNFSDISIELNSLREELNLNTKLIMAVNELSIILKNKSASQADYILLRKIHPIIDQVEFRRIFGQNEIINSWSWPEINSVNTVLDTLSERENRLNNKIKLFKIEAQASSLALETYGRLQRDEKVAKEVYKVLIDQFKAQSLATGYRPDTTEIYEYATPSIKPSEPKLSIILISGALLGLTAGCFFALLIGTLRGVFFSKKSLFTSAQARFISSSKPLISLRNKSLAEINTHLKKKPRTILRDIIVEIHKSGSTIVIITSSHSRMTANDISRALAMTVQKNGTKIALINFSEQNKKQKNNTDQVSTGEFFVSENEGNLSILCPKNNSVAIELVSQKEFMQSIQSLNSIYDLIFICADNDDAISLLRALEGKTLYHLTLARIKRTKSNNLLNMRSLLPIQGLLHD